jgi:hypothetical protein
MPTGVYIRTAECREKSRLTSCRKGKKFPHSEETKQKISVSKRIKNKSDIKYVAKHHRIRFDFGIDDVCEICGTTTAKRYEWSNKDHKYSEKREDWQRLCSSCHRRYDYSISKNIIVKCIICGIDVTTKSKIRKFCSDRCTSTYHRINKRNGSGTSLSEICKAKKD